MSENPPVLELKGLASRLPRALLEIVPATDHFFGKREREVARIVADFAEKSLGGAA